MDSNSGLADSVICAPDSTTCVYLLQYVAVNIKKKKKDLYKLPVPFQKGNSIWSLTQSEKRESN